MNTQNLTASLPADLTPAFVSYVLNYVQTGASAAVDTDTLDALEAAGLLRCRIGRRVTYELTAAGRAAL